LISGIKECKLRVSENRVQWRISGTRRDVVIRGWRKLHNEEHNFYSSPSIIRMVNSRRMRREGHVA
jgi:hypothetical protein